MPEMEEYNACKRLLMPLLGYKYLLLNFGVNILMAFRVLSSVGFIGADYRRQAAGHEVYNINTRLNKDNTTNYRTGVQV